MSDGRVSVARQFMETYADGDSDALLVCLAYDWVLHEEDGSTTSRSDLAEITRTHATAFPEKQIEWVHELVNGDLVAHYVRFTLVHSGRYHDLEPTGKQVELWEMIFHRFENDLIAESWRMTYPERGIRCTNGQVVCPSIHRRSLPVAEGILAGDFACAKVTPRLRARTRAQRPCSEPG